MGLRFRDLAMNLAVECMPGPPVPGCACTQTAPNCVKTNHPQQAPPKCEKASASGKPKKYHALETLRSQLRSELRAQG